jgi:hypothetical protein
MCAHRNAVESQSEYVTKEDLCKLFTENVNSLYLRSQQEMKGAQGTKHIHEISGSVQVFGENNQSSERIFPTADRTKHVFSFQV